MSKEIVIKAERSYGVRIGASYAESVIDFADKRERVAVVYSESMKESIPKFSAGPTEFFYFGIPDGEAVKVHTPSRWCGIG